MKTLSFRKKGKKKGVEKSKIIPYLEDKVSRSTLNQWSHDQQLVVTKDHPVIAHWKPTAYDPSSKNKQHEEKRFEGGKKTLHTVKVYYTKL